MPARRLKVLVVVLVANASEQPDARAETVFHGLLSDLEQSDLDVAVIKVPILQGVVYSNQVYVYSRSSTGAWAQAEDRSLIQAIIQAHFPNNPGST